MTAMSYQVVSSIPSANRPSARKTRRTARTLPLQLPSVVLLLLWSIVPLGMTLWFSFERYNLLNPGERGFVWFENYRFLLTDPGLRAAILNTLLLVGWVLVITVGLGTLLAVLFDQVFFGRGIARVLIIAPFFVMPTVSALIWKNMLMHPVNGVISFLMRSAGLRPIDWFSDAPLSAIIIIVAWQWLPFALLVLLTAIQSLDPERKEAARMDGAGPFAMFFFIILPHLGRAIGVVVMIETIFLLTVFAEIFVTTSGGPGFASTNLAFLIYRFALLEFDVGGASAGGVIAIVLANIVAIFLMRTIARNLEA
jgi:sorbitol/mannitol transport system permease protein